MDSLISAWNNLETAAARELVLLDTKIYAFNIATVATITFLAIAVLSGLTGGSGFAFYLVLSGLSLAGRELLRINLEDNGTLRAMVGQFFQNAIRQNNDSSQCLNKFFKFPVLDFDIYCKNLPLLCQ